MADPEGFKVGSAWLDIVPNMDGFSEKLKSAIEKDKVEAKVKVTPDTKDFKTKLDAELEADKGKDIKVKVKPVLDKADMAKADAEMSAAGKKSGDSWLKGFKDSAANAPVLPAAIGAGILEGLAIGPAALGLAGAAGGIAFSAMLVKTISTSLSKQAAPLQAKVQTLTGQITTLSSSTTLTQSNQLKLATDRQKLAYDQAHGNVKAVAALQQQIAGIQAKTQLSPANQKKLSSDQSQLALDQQKLAVLKKQESAYSAVNRAAGNLKNTAINTAGTVLTSSGILGNFAHALNQISGWISSSGMQGKFTALFKAFGSSVMPLLGIFETFIKALLPGFTRFMQDMGRQMPTLAPAFQKLGSALGNFMAAMGGKTLAQSIGAFSGLVGVISKLLPFINTLITYSATILNKWPLLGAIILGAVVAFKALSPAISAVNAAVQVAKGVWAALNFIMDLNPWVLVSAAVIALAIVIIKYHKQIWAVVTKVWGDITAFLKKWGVDILIVMSGPLGMLVAAIVKYHQQIWQFIQKIWNTILQFLKNVWNSIFTIAKNIWNSVVTFLKNTWNTIYRDVNHAWSNIANFFSSWWNREVSGWKNILNSARSMISGVWNNIKSDAVIAWDAISAGIGNAFKSVGNAVATPINGLLDLVAKFDQLIDHIPGVNLPKSFAHVKFAGGGVLPGYAPGHDTIPALLSPGESVLTPEATRVLGASNILALNASLSGRKPTFGAGKYAGGGIPGGGVLHNIGHAISSTVGAVGSMLTDPVNWVASHAAGMILNAIPGTGLGKAIAVSAAKAVISGIKNLASSSASSAGGGAGGKYGGPASFGGGFESLAALESYAKYFMSQGLSKSAAAGMAATISGEENSLGPESVGSGGFGLIGWTGNTIGLPAGYHGPTGNVAYDLAVQLAGVIGYMNSRGGAGPLNAAAGPVAAGDVWSRYEAPAVPLSDTRPGIAQRLYALGYAAGGAIPGYAPGHDTVPAMLSPGEFVINPVAAKVIGLNNLHALNGIAHFAAGGSVPTAKQRAAAAAKAARQHAAAVRAAQRAAAAQARARASAARKLTSAEIHDIAVERGLQTPLATLLNAETRGIPSASATLKDTKAAVSKISQDFTGKVADWLVSTIQHQANATASLLTRLADKLKADQTEAAGFSSYAASVTQNLAGFGDISNLSAAPTTGSGVGYGTNVVAGLQYKLGQLKTFAALVNKARAVKLSKVFIGQAVAMGPDGGTQYLQAVLASPALIKSVNTLEGQLTTAETGVGTSAAQAQYGTTLGAIQAQEKAIEKSMQKAGHVFAAQVEHDFKHATSGLKREVSITVNGNLSAAEKKKLASELASMLSHMNL